MTKQNILTAIEEKDSQLMDQSNGWQDENEQPCTCNPNWEWCEAPGCGDRYVLAEIRRGVELGMDGYIEKAKAAI